MYRSNYKAYFDDVEDHILLDPKEFLKFADTKLWYNLIPDSGHEGGVNPSEDDSNANIFAVKFNSIFTSIGGRMGNMNK